MPEEPQLPPPQPQPDKAAKPVIDPGNLSWFDDLIAASAATSSVEAAAENEVIRAESDAEAASYEADKREYEIQVLTNALERAKEIHQWRKLTLMALFTLTLLWLGAVVWFVWLAATHWDLEHAILADDERKPLVFHLSDNVLIAFITSTTVSVIGIFLIAARWLFRPGQSASEEKDDK